MHVTASWGGAEVTVEVDAECRSMADLKKCLQEALPKLDVEALNLEVGGRSIDDDEGVLSLSEGSIIDISATQAALAVAKLRQENWDVGFNGFCRAARAGDLRLCRLYLEIGVVWPAGTDNPLRIAVIYNNPALCQLLLDSDCPKDPKDREGNTPLHHTVYANNQELCQFLLDSGCDKNEKDGEGNTLLHGAVAVYNPALGEVLLSSGCAKDARNACGFTPLQQAVYASSVEFCKLLLDSGCDADEKDGEGNTLLHSAVQAYKHTGSLSTCELLLDSGCAKDEKDDEGKTPLQVAYDLNRPELYQLLLSRGCVCG